MQEQNHSYSVMIKMGGISQRSPLFKVKETNLSSIFRAAVTATHSSKTCLAFSFVSSLCAKYVLPKRRVKKY